MGGNHEKARASDGLLLSQQCEISISFNWRDEKAFFGTESAPAAGVTGSRKRQHGRLLGLDVLTG